ncbi:hypothetical protein [Alteribacillus bidgolensis]|uniref:Uncharacterized protein n=1 Tax=Alteribacillus bidgolensis TaxID=930129 RepID=A0A1G8C1V5_9BACI|nr:hypothetical protein [Alteribacillus bidgolensis]SDH39354.1 hypothetical protein SAMN05216352_101163 [Alteribacillus bidgolensis]
MMNSNRQGDQAESLRRRTRQNKIREERSINVYSLPPRSEVHKKRKKVMLKYPMVRLLLVLFILIVLIAVFISIQIGSNV